jgi:hypothetical protein
MKQRPEETIEEAIRIGVFLARFCLKISDAIISESTSVQLIYH